MRDLFLIKFQRATVGHGAGWLESFALLYGGRHVGFLALVYHGVARARNTLVFLCMSRQLAQSSLEQSRHLDTASRDVSRDESRVPEPGWQISH